MCKVSICIPAYNNVSLVKRLLDSIIIQTYKDYEIVITDDSNTDDVQRYVIDLGDKKLHYYKNLKRLGATDNCNKAISMASGEYIKIMHQDDFFSFDESLRLMVEMLDQNADCDLAFSGTYQVSSCEKRARSILDSDFSEIERDYHHLFKGNYIGGPSATIFRNKNFSFDEKLTWLVDVELYMRILAKNSKIVKLDFPLISIGISERQLTNSCKSNWLLQIKEYFYIYIKHGLYRRGRYTLELADAYRLILKDILIQKYKRIEDILQRNGV